MPTYDVLVTRDVTESASVRVEAATPAEAEQRAVKLARENPQDYGWETDDNLWREYYIGDAGDAATEVDFQAILTRNATIEQLSDRLFALEKEFSHEVQLAFDEVIYEHFGTGKDASSVNNQGFHGQVEALAERYSVVFTTEIVEAFIQDWRNQHAKND